MTVLHVTGISITVLRSVYKNNCLQVNYDELRRTAQKEAVRWLLKTQEIYAIPLSTITSIVTDISKMWDSLMSYTKNPNADMTKMLTIFSQMFSNLNTKRLREKY